ncbi:uncharacterized protein LOC108047681 [Drosophila rhopaloa]|uniref:Uncharacterized protein n=1 Tax=Drosophila rhopaloa TaxID=1041015 RepID=A0ABM5HPN5_DRORH|nr:uncharacterized protein LOC108047681 [Drosophila rhopaloa]
MTASNQPLDAGVKLTPTPATAALRLRLRHKEPTQPVGVEEAKREASENSAPPAPDRVTLLLKAQTGEPGPHNRNRRAHLHIHIHMYIKKNKVIINGGNKVDR